MGARFASAKQQGLTEEKIAGLADYEHQDFTPREKAAIRFGEMMAANHYAVDDELFEELREHFNEAEIIELGWTAAACIGFGRLIFALGVQRG